MVSNETKVDNSIIELISVVAQPRDLDTSRKTNVDLRIKLTEVVGSDKKMEVFADVLISSSNSSIMLLDGNKKVYSKTFPLHLEIGERLYRLPIEIFKLNNDPYMDFDSLSLILKRKVNNNIVLIAQDSFSISTI